MHGLQGCPLCGGFVTVMGPLATATWGRCRSCGTDSPIRGGETDWDAFWRPGKEEQ